MRPSWSSRFSSDGWVENSDDRLNPGEMAGVKKKALNIRGERTCLVCKQPLSHCRCYRMP